MSDADLRELERRAFFGDDDAFMALMRERQRRCSHEWDSLGNFSPGFSDLGGGEPGPGEWRLYLCHRCGSTRSNRGENLCIWCERPAGDEPLRADDDGCHLEHPSCAEEWREDP